MSIGRACTYFNIIRIRGIDVVNTEINHLHRSFYPDFPINALIAGWAGGRLFVSGTEPCDNLAISPIYYCFLFRVTIFGDFK